MIAPPPPLLAMLPAGTRLVAGCGYSTVLPDMDFETYSEAGYVWDEAAQKWCDPKGAQAGKGGLFAVGAAVYTEHATCDALVLSYNLKRGAGAQRWHPGQPPPQDLIDYLAAGGVVESHNCAFERWVWNNVCVPRYGFPVLRVTSQRCSMAKARAHALPGGLADLGRVLGIEHQKDPAGDALLKLFSRPRTPTKTDPRRRIRPQDDPVQAERLYRYCDRDTVAESEASSLIPDLSESELEFWLIDQQINERGVQIDLAAVEDCIAVIEQAFERYNAELHALTGGAVDKASQLERLRGWLAGRGWHVGSLDEEGLEAELRKLANEVDRVTFHGEGPVILGHYQELHRALEIRQLVGSASVKKLYAMRNQATRAGRLHDLFGYHAARTGRTNGQGPQPTNLPNSGPDVRVCTCRRHYGLNRTSCPWCFAVAPPAPPAPLPNRSVAEWSTEAVADALSVIATRSLDVVEACYGDAVRLVSACLRGLFIAAPEHDLVSSDYTAIEAVVLACLAGEQWRIDLFRAKGKIYEASGAKVRGLSYEEVIEYKARTGNHHACRKQGKVLELACGFGGWIGALKAFGADEFMTEDEMRDCILAWRDASPAIVEFWGGQKRGRGYYATPEMYGLEGMALSAVMYPGQEFAHRGITYFTRGDVLYCRLVSGRLLTYHAPRVRQHPTREGLELSFMGWNTNPKMGPIGWVRLTTYGGKLTENVVQATARDILVHAVINGWRAGYKTVLHVYDELVAEVPQGFGSVEEFERIMSTTPAWAADWPVSASGGWRGARYRK